MLFFPRQPVQAMWAQMVIFSCSLQSGHIELRLCRCWIISNSAATESNIWWETWHMLLHLLDQMSDWSSPAQSAQSPLTSWNISKRAHSTFYIILSTNISVTIEISHWNYLFLPCSDWRTDIFSEECVWGRGGKSVDQSGQPQLAEICPSSSHPWE